MNTNKIHIILLIAFLFLHFGCSEQKGKIKTTVQSQKESNQEKESVPTEEVVYNDSMVNEMIKNEMQKYKSTEIDTFQALHSFDEANFLQIHLKDINQQALKDYEKTGDSVSEAQKDLLGITNYLSDLSFSEGFKMYLFYNRSEESHYGNSIELITIPEHSNKFEKLTLTQFYGNENYEKVINSFILSKDTIKREITEYSGAGDTNGGKNEKPKPKITLETYIITKTGTIRLIQ